MGTNSSDQMRFPISADDLKPLIELLVSQKPQLNGEPLENTQLIVTDLLSLPNADIGPFSINMLSRFRADDPESGHGSEWVSLEATDEGMSFSAGNHVYSPGLGGDSSSETIFECGPCGGSTGDLNSWLSALASMDKSSMEISAVHENKGDEVMRRDDLIAAYKMASSDTRLSPQMRTNANRHLRNLSAISPNSTANGGEDRFQHVRLDHYAHKFAIFAVAAFGWQLHGWAVGVALLIGLLLAISATNVAVMAMAPEPNVLQLLRVNRWAWIFVGVTGVAYSGASIVSG